MAPSGHVASTRTAPGVHGSFMREVDAPCMNSTKALLFVDDGYPESRDYDDNYIDVDHPQPGVLSSFLSGLFACLRWVRPY